MDFYKGRRAIGVIQIIDTKRFDCWCIEADWSEPTWWLPRFYLEAAEPVDMWPGFTVGWLRFALRFALHRKPQR